MTITSNEFFDAQNRDQELFSNLNSELSWRYINSFSVGVEHTSNDIKNNATDRAQSADPKAGGKDIFVFFKNNKDKILRIKTNIPKQAKGRVRINYNFPRDIRTKEEMYSYLKLHNVYFLAIRRKRLSNLFCLIKASDYPIEYYETTNRQFTGRTRDDRIVLLAKYIEKIWKILNKENLNKEILKTIENENKQKRT